MGREAVKSRSEGGVRVLTPALGGEAGPEQLLAELRAAIEQAHADASCRALVLAIEGDPLLALDGASPEGVVRHARAVHALLERLARGRKPAFAALLSDCSGAGLDLALACHVTVASESLRLGPFRDAPSGFGAQQRLMRRAGSEPAARLLLSAEPLPIGELAPGRWPGLLSPADDCEQRAIALAAGCAERNVAQLEALLEGLHAGAELPLDDALELEAQLAGLVAARTKRS